MITGLGPTGNFYGPALLPDNQTLYFSHVRDADEDLYRTARDDRGGVFADPVALSDMNTGTLDGSPFVTPDGVNLPVTVGHFIKSYEEVVNRVPAAAPVPPDRP